MIVISSNFSQRVWPVFALVLFLSVFNSGFAQTKTGIHSNEKWPRYSLELGGYLTNINSTFRVGLDNLGLGLDINFEEALGLNTTAITFRTQFLWRFSKNKKSALRVSYFQIVRRSTKVLKTDLEIRDTILTAGTEIGSRFSLGITKLDYKYSFLLDDRINFHFSAGFFVLPISFNLQKEDSEVERTDFIAPLPAFGIGTKVYLSPKLALNQSLNIFYISIPGLKGSMTDVNVALEYHPWEHVGFGLGYNSFAINIESNKEGGLLIGDLVGNVKFRQVGLMFYGVFSL